MSVRGRWWRVGRNKKTAALCRYNDYNRQLWRFISILYLPRVRDGNCCSKPGLYWDSVSALTNFTLIENIVKDFNFTFACLCWGHHLVKNIIPYFRVQLILICKYLEPKATSGKPEFCTKNISQVHPLYTKCRIKLNLLQSWKVKSQLQVKWLLLRRPLVQQNYFRPPVSLF